MEKVASQSDLLSLLMQFIEQAKVLLIDPAFWVQFLIIGVVFAISRWLLRPVLLRGLKGLSKRTARVTSFIRVWEALEDTITPLGWLMLQWVAVKLSSHFKYDNVVLITVTSLLTAWLLIRLASMLVSNLALQRFIAWAAWTVAALNIFGWLTPVMSILDSWAFTIGTVRISPLTAIKVAFSLWFALWLATGASSLIERKMNKWPSSNAATRVLFAKLTRILFISAAILLALSSVGIDLTALAVFSGALGVGLGFGLQKIFSNLVSGVILLMDRSLKPGDVIAVNNTFGWINYLGARYASIITRDGTEHLIPNEEFITQRVENWSYSNDLVRLKIPIGISYHSDPRKAIALCVEAAGKVVRVKDDPEPKCQMMGFGDSSVNLELRIWISDPPNGRANVCSEVLLEVWDKFHENGIEIPFPQRDLHVKSVLGEKDLANIQQAFSS
jgi:small-conductance mechanosensitive channel